jgi:hypothetical protein
MLVLSRCKLPDVVELLVEKAKEMGLGAALDRELAERIRLE